MKLERNIPRWWVLRPVSPHFEPAPPTCATQLLWEFDKAPDARELLSLLALREGETVTPSR